MTSPSDIDHTINLASASIATIPRRDRVGHAARQHHDAFRDERDWRLLESRAPRPVCQAGRLPAAPQRPRPLHHIDPNKYRILTAEIGLPNKPRDLCGGSIVRVVWNVAGEANESYSWGITLNSRGGANVVNRLNFDMAAIPVDPAARRRAAGCPA